MMIERGKCGRLSRPFDSRAHARGYSALQKGGDPAAGSPTATLLRLRPSHRIDLRRLPPCGWPTGFGSLRLPWRDGRCVQGPGTYYRGVADPRLLAIPASCSRVADCNPNLARLLAIGSPSPVRDA